MHEKRNKDKVLCKFFENRTSGSQNKKCFQKIFKLIEN
ncbi:hypothetical protein KIS4809_1597 [Bacillus sp. ZZV12-4809]|nr:hypothetical protein KIS4809_1597 [Bacillus sp. ZZV12-4809]